MESAEGQGHADHWDNGHLARWRKRWVSSISTGGTPVVPVAFPNGRDARCPSRAPPAGKGAKRLFNASSVKVEVMVGCREKTLCVKFIYDWR